MVSQRTLDIIERARRQLEPPPNLQLPPWCSELRPSQIEAIKAAVEAFERGIRCVVVDAPTGTGKTLIGESVRQALNASALYVCHSKSLQDQFAEDFDYAKVLKGRSNYATLHPDRSIRASDCNKVRVGESEWVCSCCSDRVRDCPYEVAKRAALQSQLSVVNTSYLLTEGNGPGRFKGRGLVIADEADTLENELMRFVSVEITEATRNKYGLGNPSKVTKEETWLEWVATSIPILTKKIPRIDHFEQDKRKVREHIFLSSLVGKLRVLESELENGGWVYVGGKDSLRFSFKPVTVTGVGAKQLWPLGKRWLLMSATIISPDQLLNDLGWEEDFEFIAVGSGFRKENRQVKVAPIADMSRRANERDLLRRGIEAISARHPGERMLLHTVSYDLARWLHQNLHVPDVPTLTYSSSHERDTTLARFVRTEGAILIAPSFDRGIDLPDDACRVVVVCKVPFPYLGDKQVSARLYSKGGQNWYNVQTVRSIVQMTGRATRHENDWSVNYILDKQFVKLYRQNQRLFPQWWREAVDWKDPLAIAIRA